MSTVWLLVLILAMIIVTCLIVLLFLCLVEGMSPEEPTGPRCNQAGWPPLFKTSDVVIWSSAILVLLVVDVLLLRALLTR